MSGFREGASEVNLAALNEAVEGLSLDDRRALRDHLLGGLTCFVDPEDFAQVLACAVDDARKWSRDREGVTL